MTQPLASKKPCPCCDGALLFVFCPDCNSLLGWCSESDCAVGKFEGTQLVMLGTGEKKGWAREGCANCGSNSLLPATREELNLWGLANTAREA